MRCATDTWQQVPASVSYPSVRTRSTSLRPFLQFVHVSSATSINVNFERPVARGACIKVSLIFPHYIPRAYYETHSKVNPFPGILYLTLSFNSLHHGIFWDKSDFSRFHCDDLQKFIYLPLYIYIYLYIFIYIYMYIFIYIYIYIYLFIYLYIFIFIYLP